MNGERWHRVDDLFAAALELEASERAAFLSRECSGDDALRGEVEAMLAAARDSGGFLETPAIEQSTAIFIDAGTEPGAREESASGLSRRSIDQARFIPGDIVAGRYRIAGLLGKGGMGEVYRADDLKLEQPVALKFLAESLSMNGAALARFHREVSLARQVSHRHVCRVYDIGEHAGMHFLSMEYVRGEELSSLLRRVGRLPLEKAVETARQLCAGLAAIHATGVLHRDLKPANVMIDEHGEVRITDFGVAALSEGVQGREAMVGTPAYMAPEQLTGGELTPRSDVYALGLVLYEAFTGNRPFPASSLEEIVRLRLGDSSPTSPSMFVTGLDPLVERVILRCLEKDPERRPESALQVAGALPGGDPLAAALAAGETPSPQMVAASGREGGLNPLPATLLLVAILAGLALVTFFSKDVALHRLMPLPRSQELLRNDAAAIARLAGHVAPAADSASGFQIDFGAAQSMSDRIGDGFRERLKSDPLPGIQFWFRSSPTPLLPNSAWILTLDDPPARLPGMIALRLDPAGRLLFLERVPTPADAAVRPAQWERFFERAALPFSAFRETAPAGISPQQNDQRLAWTGVHPGWPEIPLRVEAASWRGAPVYFEVIWPWTGQAMAPPEERSRLFLFILLALYFGAIGLGVLFAWRNLRLGRGDRRGAIRLTLFVFVSRIVYWIFLAHHIDSVEEVSLVIEGLQSALYWAAIIGLLYLALEPFLRRRWPEGLISWTRLLGGEGGNPLVGRDILIGGTFAMGIVLALQLLALPLPFLNRTGGLVTNSTLLYQHGLDGVRGFFPLLVNQTSASIMFPLILTSTVLFFALLTRRHSIAVGVTWLILYALFVLNFGDGSAFGYVVTLVVPTIMIVALTRYGLLTLVSTFFFQHVWPFYPVTPELSAWYSTTWLLQLALLAAIALYAYRSSLAGQKVLSGAFLEA